MEYGYITFRSITYAQKGESLLRSKGYSPVLQRTPAWMEAMGCGYCLRLSLRELQQAVRVLSDHQVVFRKVYRPGQNGKMVEGI